MQLFIPIAGSWLIRIVYKDDVTAMLNVILHQNLRFLPCLEHQA
jgi:hypothetical protein